MRYIFSLLLALMATGLFSHAVAANEPAAGDAVAVIQDANGELDGTKAAIITGDGIYMGQRIVTGNVGQVQVVFADNTHLVIGPRSTLVIASYLMRNDGTANKVVVNALAGSFRFLTGNSPKKAYEINTPTGTLGVRGTAFDFNVDHKSTRVLLYHGGVDMCGADGTCVPLDDPCSVGVIPRSENAAVLGDNDKRKRPILGGFKYLNSQLPLREDFRFPDIGKCKERRAETFTKVDSPPPPPPAAPIVPPQPPERCPPREEHGHGWPHHPEPPHFPRPHPPGPHHEGEGDGWGGPPPHQDGPGEGGSPPPPPLGGDNEGGAPPHPGGGSEGGPPPPDQGEGEGGPGHHPQQGEGWGDEPGPDFGEDGDHHGRH